MVVVLCFELYECCIYVWGVVVYGLCDGWEEWIGVKVGV